MLTSDLSEACFICGLSSCELEACPRCEVRWCCPAHRDLHLDSETGACFPFTVRWTEEVGRCVLASRDIRYDDDDSDYDDDDGDDDDDIRAGELIFREAEPFVIGPKHECPPLCLVCHAPCDSGGVACEGCGYPVCEAECGARHLVTRECGLLARAPAPVFTDPEARSSVYHPILPLR